MRGFKCGEETWGFPLMVAMAASFNCDLQVMWYKPASWYPQWAEKKTVLHVDSQQSGMCE